MLAPHLLVEKKDINKYVLMPGDPGRVLRITKHLKNSKKINVNREYTIYNGTYKGKKITVCSSGMGGPSTAIAIHELVSLGAKVIIRVGSCGSLQKGMQLGELIIPNQTIREDGTTNMYVAKDIPALVDKKVHKLLLKSCEELGVKFYSGTSRSHDSFYTKNNAKLERFWSKVGILGSDFETSTLFIVGKILGIKTGSVLNIVSCYGKKDVKKDISKFQQKVKKGIGATAMGERNSIIVALNTINKL